MKKMAQLKVAKKEDQGDRVLLYGSDPNYHLIADVKDVVEVGDTVEYEECGVNFGWFKKVLTRPILEEKND